MRVVDGEPVWRDGDVVRVQFERKDGTTSQQYEYIRRDGYWPGQHEWSSHDDAEMTAAWHDNRLLYAAMVEAPVHVDAQPLTEPYDLVRLRILERAVSMVRDIIDSAPIDRSAAALNDEIRAVLP